MAKIGGQTMSVTYPKLSDIELVEKFNEITMKGTLCLYFPLSEEAPFYTRILGKAHLIDGMPVVQLNYGHGPSPLSRLAIPNGFIWYGKNLTANALLKGEKHWE